MNKERKEIRRKRRIERIRQQSQGEWSVAAKLFVFAYLFVHAAIAIVFATGFVDNGYSYIQAAFLSAFIVVFLIAPIIPGLYWLKKILFRDNPPNPRLSASHSPSAISANSAVNPK